MTDLATLSDEQLNVKLAKRSGWKLVGGKWWHDDEGDGPPQDACKVFGRELIVRVLSKEANVGEEYERVYRNLVASRHFEAEDRQ